MGTDTEHCYCRPVFDCGSATSEVETGDIGQEVWRPVCERCMQIAWEAGFRIRKLQVKDGS